jgi:hypothetical protein
MKNRDDKDSTMSASLILWGWSQALKALREDERLTLSEISGLETESESESENEDSEAEDWHFLDKNREKIEKEMEENEARMKQEEEKIAQLEAKKAHVEKVDVKSLDLVALLVLKENLLANKNKIEEEAKLLRLVSKEIEAKPLDELRKATEQTRIDRFRKELETLVASKEKERKMYTTEIPAFDRNNNPNYDDMKRTEREKAMYTTEVPAFDRNKNPNYKQKTQNKPSTKAILQSIGVTDNTKKIVVSEEAEKKAKTSTAAVVPSDNKEKKKQSVDNDKEKDNPSLTKRFF